MACCVRFSSALACRVKSAAHARSSSPRRSRQGAQILPRPTAPILAELLCKAWSSLRKASRSPSAALLAQPFEQDFGIRQIFLHQFADEFGAAQLLQALDRHVHRGWAEHAARTRVGRASTTGESLPVRSRAIRSTSASSAAGSTGLMRQSSMPASRQRLSVRAVASAVRPTMGSRRFAGCHHAIELGGFQPVGIGHVEVHQHDVELIRPLPPAGRAPGRRSPPDRTEWPAASRMREKTR